MIDFSKISIRTIQGFSVKIRINVQTFLDLYSYYVENHQPRITEYFLSPDTEPDADSFDFLEELLKQYYILKDRIKINRRLFNKYDAWELLDLIEQVGTSLETMNNTSKYTRSSKTKNSWRSAGLVDEIIMGQNETIEDISYEELEVGDRNNDWVNLAISNNLMEQDYNVEGGVKLTIHKGNRYGRIAYLNSVIDNLIGERLYGKDIHKKITFVDNDLNILEYIETFTQSVLILATLKKGDAPEFPLFGRNAGIGIGSNVNVFEFGLLNRQMEQVFSTDDTMRDFNVIDYFYKEGILSIDFEVDSFYNLNLKQTIQA